MYDTFPCDWCGGYHTNETKMCSARIATLSAEDQARYYKSREIAHLQDKTIM